MKIKTAELNGAALAWAVGQYSYQCYGLIWKMVDGVMCGVDPEDDTVCVFVHNGSFAKDIKIRTTIKHAERYQPHVNWLQGGPIIDREKIDICHHHAAGEISAMIWVPRKAMALGPTPLTAAMRCYVASKLGDEVEVPDELA